MKIFKRILIILLVLVAIPLVAALFVKKDFMASQEIIINKPNAEVFNYVKYLKNQNNYSKWALMDPNMKKTYRGTDATVGFVSAWESESDDLGTGEQEIVAIEDNHKIDYELRFLKPFKMTNKATMTTEAVTDSTTKVVWTFSGRMKYPMNIMGLFVDFEKSINNDFHEGLTNLKNILEKPE